MNISTTTRRVALALPLVAAGWLGTMAAVVMVPGAAPAAVALFPPADFLARLPEGAVVSATRFSVTIRSDAPGLAAALYRAGAAVVLPAGLEPCAPAAAR